MPTKEDFLSESRSQFIVCCDAMYSERRNGDEIIFAPQKGKGASLTIRYSLPRDCRYSMFTENFPNAAVHLVERVGPSRWCDGRKCRSPPRALIDHDDPRLFARLARCQAALSSNVRLCPKILSGCVSSEQDRIGFAARVEVPAFIRFRARQAPTSPSVRCRSPPATGPGQAGRLATTRPGCRPRSSS